MLRMGLFMHILLAGWFLLHPTHLSSHFRSDVQLSKMTQRTMPGGRVKKGKPRLAVKISALKQKAAGSGQVRRSGAAVAQYELLTSAISEVERKAHKRNPFKEQYVKLCLSAFPEVSNLHDEEFSKEASWLAV